MPLTLDMNFAGPDGTVKSVTLTAPFVSVGVVDSPAPAETLPTIECLTTQSIVNIIESNGNKYVFNNSPSYDSNIAYGLGIGTYTFKNISEEHPMALLNSEKTSMITYSGDSSKTSSKEVDGVNYDFYHGDITVQVNSDFGTISVYCINHGYMGGQDLLKYSETCLIQSEPEPASAGPMEANIMNFPNQMDVGQTYTFKIGILAKGDIGKVVSIHFPSVEGLTFSKDGNNLGSYTIQELSDITLGFTVSVSETAPSRSEQFEIAFRDVANATWIIYPQVSIFIPAPANQNPEFTLTHQPSITDIETGDSFTVNRIKIDIAGNDLVGQTLQLVSQVGTGQESFYLTSLDEAGNPVDLNTYNITLAESQTFYYTYNQLSDATPGDNEVNVFFTLQNESGDSLAQNNIIFNVTIPEPLTVITKSLVSNKTNMNVDIPQGEMGIFTHNVYTGEATSYDITLTHADNTYANSRIVSIVKEGENNPNIIDSTNITNLVGASLENNNIVLNASSATATLTLDADSTYIFTVKSINNQSTEGSPDLTISMEGLSSSYDDNAIFTTGYSKVEPVFSFTLNNTLQYNGGDFDTGNKIDGFNYLLKDKTADYTGMGPSDFNAELTTGELIGRHSDGIYYIRLVYNNNDVLIVKLNNRGVLTGVELNETEIGTSIYAVDVQPVGWP